MVCDENGSLGYMYMVISTLRLNYGSLRYGYIHFETEEAARTAIERVNGMLLNGKKMYVQLSYVLSKLGLGKKNPWFPLVFLKKKVCR